MNDPRQNLRHLHGVLSQVDAHNKHSSELAVANFMMQRTQA